MFHKLIIITSNKMPMLIILIIIKIQITNINQVGAIKKINLGLTTVKPTINKTQNNRIKVKLILLL